MKVIALQSGSNGNCIYVEAAGKRLLFDAGISGKRAEARLASRGGDIRTVDALLVSHDHTDHVSCAGVFHRKFDLPVYMTPPTYRAASSSRALGKFQDLRHFAAGDTLRFGQVSVETIATPHDAADGVAFVVDDGCHRLGILTDLGHLYDDLFDVVASLDAVVLESNYDPVMLECGSYPAFLKRRIQGRHGHLSNEESAELLNRAGRKLGWACLAHLSAENNDPARALGVHRAVMGERFQLHHASRAGASELLTV